MGSVVSSIEELTFDLEAEVICSYNTDTLSDTALIDSYRKGWLWDRRIIEDPILSSHFYGEYLGGHTVGLKDGLKKSWWVSGNESGINYVGIERYRDGDSFTWTPYFTIGQYTVYFENRSLFSDLSFTGKFNIEDNQNGVNTISLREDAIDSTIRIALFERDSGYINRFKYFFDYVTTFTGKLEDGATSRLPTESNGSILWSQLCDRANEYQVINGTVYLNNDYSIVVGGFTGSLSKVILEDLYEDAGVGYSHGRDIYTRYFPIQENSLKLYVISGLSFEEYTEVANLNFSNSTDKHFSVDEDLGIITIGGYQAPDLVLSEDIDENDTEIQIFLTEDIESYPAQGIIILGGEQILYYERGRSVFYDCIRGYNGTSINSHSKYSIVSDIQHGKAISASQKIYLGYAAVPRIEYEVTGCEYRSACPSYSPLDVRPIQRLDNTGVIQLASSIPHLAEIVLEIDKELISSDLYGPVYFGTDTARLTATAYDSFGNPVEGINITIVQDSGPGSLSGGLSSYTSLSNTSGQIFTLYNSPYSWTDIARAITAINYIGGDTVFTVPELTSGLSPSDITLYQVLKHDLTIGSQGEKTEISNFANDGTLDDGTVVGYAFIDIENVYSDIDSKFKNGIAYILCTDNVTYSRGVTHTVNLYSLSGELEGHRLYLDGTVSGFNTGLAVRAWLLSSNAEEFSVAPLNGTPVLVYDWNPAVQHPITGSLGAYMPLSPSALTTTTLTYSGRLLSQPEPFNRDSNLGAYIFVAPAISTFHAYGTDPVSGRVVMSNNIRLLIDLPAFLKGVDYSGALPIPYGFTFISEEHNIGTGLGGTNFLTINPKSDSVSFFTLNANFGY